MADTSQQALQDLQGFQGQMKSGSDLLAGQEAKLGIPQAQQQVSGLRQAITNTTNLLNQIPSSVYGRAANSLVTSGQAGRQIQNESAPVQSKLQGQNQDYSQQESDLQQLTGKAQTGAQLDLQDQQNKVSLLQSIYQNLFGKEQADASQRLEQQKLQEQIREANMSNAVASSKSTDSNPSAAEVKQAAASHIVGQLNSLRGRDGYVSNETWANALNDWTTAGGTARQFFQNYSSYVNPKYKTSYAGWANR